MEMPDWLFQTLTPKEEEEFRQAARVNHKPGAEIDGTWHPIYRDECRIIDDEAT